MTDYTLDALDHSEPVAGYYAGQMVRGGPRCPVRIWYGPPIDPETGDVMERSYRWLAERCGAPVDLNEVWPWVAQHAISYAQFEGLMRLAEWARETDPGYFTRPAVATGEMDMTGDFEWELFAGQFMEAVADENADGIEAAAGRLKDMAPMDVERVWGHGVEVRRAANGAARVRKMEESDEK